MRSKKPSLDDVIAEFEEWRRHPHERRIPERLWRSAISLTDRHAPSTVSRHLRLSPATFKKMRAALGAERVKAVPASRRRRRRRAACSNHVVATKGTSARVFAELVPANGAVPVVARGAMAGVGGYRLVLESARGTIAVTAPTADRGLLEAMWQAMSGVLRGVGA